MVEVYQWVGVVVLWFVIALLAFLAVSMAAFAVAHVFGIGIGGYRVVRADEYYELEDLKSRTLDCHRWLSSFKDLDILWNYILAFKVSHGSIEDVRKAYAEARGRTVYNEPLDVEREVYRTAPATQDGEGSGQVSIGLADSAPDPEPDAAEKPIWDNIDALKEIIGQKEVEDEEFDVDSLAGLGPLDRQRVIADRILELETKRNGGRLRNGSAE